MSKHLMAVGGTVLTTKLRTVSSKCLWRLKTWTCVFVNLWWIISHCLGLGHETMVCVVCLTTFLWRHQMETFPALLALCVGNSPVTGEFPRQRPVKRSFVGVFFDLRPNKQLSKESWGWWSDTPSRPLWRHCNAKDIEIRPNLTAQRVLSLNHSKIRTH